MSPIVRGFWNSVVFVVYKPHVPTSGQIWASGLIINLQSLPSWFVVKVYLISINCLSWYHEIYKASKSTKYVRFCLKPNLSKDPKFYHRFVLHSHFSHPYIVNYIIIWLEECLKWCSAQKFQINWIKAIPNSDIK